MSPEYISKYVTIMTELVKKPLYCTMKNNEFTFYSGETQDITSIEQLVIYATFLQDNAVKEHFVGLIPVSKVVGTHLSAVNIMGALELFFKDLDIPLRYAKFACMDTTNVNSGDRNGLKRHLEHIVPMLRLIGCNNHKLALCFKHLIPQFPSINDTDTFLLNLWRFFKYQPLAKNFLEENASMYGQDPVTAVCPSETCWTSHERACKAFHKGYKQFLDALAVCYNEHKESEALGLFILAVTPEIIATVLMLLEVFNFICPLILFLQKGQDSLCLSQAQTVVDLTVLNLKNAVHKKTYFKEEEFNQMYLQATEQVLSLPPSTNLRREPFSFASFQNNTYAKFISAFEGELQKAFEQMHFWKCFSVFDPRGLPENINEITNYGNEELESLIDHYGNIKQDTFKGNTITQDPDIDAEKTYVEWQGFKHFMYLKRGAHRRKIDIEIQLFKDGKSEKKDEALS